MVSYDHKHFFFGRYSVMVNFLTNTRLLLISLIIGAVSICMAAETRTASEGVDKIMAAAKSKNQEALSQLLVYPLRREYPLPPIGNAQEFIQRFHEIFDDGFLEMIASSNVKNDWEVMGYKGTMFKHGLLWLDEAGRVLAVNHQSDAEKQKMHQMIEMDKSQVHPSIRTFEKPILKFETQRFRVRIDLMPDQTYRYASWPLKKSMGEKPELVLYKGEETYDGSGGNHTYVFKNGSYRYERQVAVLGVDGQDKGSLKVYKKDQLILSDPVVREF